MLYIAVALLCVCQFAAALLVLWGISRIIERQKAELSARARAALEEWLVPEAEGQPHKLAQLVAAMGEVIGSSAARSIMASLSADKSHVARVANGMTDELQGVQNPLVGLLAGGRRGRGAAVARLTQMLGAMFNNLGGQSNSPGSNGHSDVADRIRNQAR